MKTIPILFAFDTRFEMPAGVCFTSLLENASPETFYDIIILHGKESDFSQSKLLALPSVYPNCRISFRCVDDAFLGAHEIRGITIATYYRLLAPELIPEYSKILYSDVDVIFREDLGHFYELDLKNCYFAGVDTGSAIRPGAREDIEKLGLDYRKGYFYAGNIVLNLELMRRDRMVEKFIALSKNNFPQQDMDILNIACNGRVLPLGLSFCLSVQLYKLLINERDAMLTLYPDTELKRALEVGILHYNGAKPWQSTCLNMDIWWSYYRKSMWYNEHDCYRFWSGQANILEELSLMKRVKLLARRLIGMK